MSRPSETARAGLVVVAMLFARTIAHALIAAWTPLEGGDWDHVLWAIEHPDDRGVAAVAHAHPMLPDLLGYGLARSPVLHVIGTPFVTTMLIVMLFVAVRRRAPSARWRDVVDLLAISAALWLAPHAGLALSDRQLAAHLVWPSAVLAAAAAGVRAGTRTVKGVAIVVGLAAVIVTAAAASATTLELGFVISLALAVVAPLALDKLAARARVVACVVAIAIDVAALSTGVVHARRADVEQTARLDALLAAPASSLAAIPAHADGSAGYWAAGEDWGVAARRERIARTVFGLADIVLVPSSPAIEPSPQVSVVLEVTGATTDQLLAARRPNLWPRSVPVARRVFADLAARLVVAAPRATLHLAVTNVDGPALNGRPVDIAWVGSDSDTVIPSPDDALGDTLAARFSELAIVGPNHDGAWALVACDPSRCVLVQAYVPHEAP